MHYSTSQSAHEGIARYFNLHPDQQPPDIQLKRAARTQRTHLSITGDTLTPMYWTTTLAQARRMVIPHLSPALNTLPVLCPPEDWQDTRPESWRAYDPTLIAQAKGLTFHNYDQRYPHKYDLTPTARRYYADLALYFHMETSRNRGGTTPQVTAFLEAFGQGLVTPALTWEEYNMLQGGHPIP